MSQPLHLRQDNSLLTIDSFFPQPLQLWMQSAQCEGCPLFYNGDVNPFDNYTLVLNSTSGTNLTLITRRGHNTICSIVETFGEMGEYFLLVTGRTEEEIECSLTTIKTPRNSNLPLIISILFYVILGCAHNREKLLRICRKVQDIKFFYIQSREIKPISSECPTLPYVMSDVFIPPKEGRLRSLDSFRGILVIAVMIFANFSNGDYLVMEHAPWNGLRISDVILPCFVWVMGVSTAMSFNSKLCKGVSRWMLFRRIVTRSLLMIIIGVVINVSLVLNRKDFPSKLRIPGVLQLIGVSFFIASTVHLFFFKRNNDDNEQCWHPVNELLLCKGEYLTMLIILSVHTLIMFFLEVPGCPRGYQGPGGLHMNGKYQNCTGGATGYIDLLVFGENHVFQSPACKSIYNTTVPFDPEGLLATFTSSFLVFIGIQNGRTLLAYLHWKTKLTHWTCWIIVLGATAYALAGGFGNDGLIPVNKNIWSLSFVLTISFIALTVFIILYVTVDVMKLWNGGPFHYPGMNPLFLFIGHALFSQMFPWKWKVAGYSRLQRIILDLWGAAVWIGVSFYLYYKKIFFSL